MACLQLSSNNKDFPFIIKKNPNSLMKMTSMKKGFSFGYYNDYNTYNVVFFDEFDEISFSKIQSQEYEMLDYTRYNSPLFITNALREYFNSTLNSLQEQDICDDSIQHIFYVHSIEIKRFDLVQKIISYFPSYQIAFHPIDDEEQCNDYSMTIIVKNKSIYELLNFVYMLSTCMIIFNHIQYNCDMGIITKTVHALNIVNAPYYVRYLIKIFIIHKKEFFEKVQTELENNSTYKIEMCFLPNQKMREQVVKNELSFKNQIIDFGCGEGHYLGLSKKLDNNLYYAIDKNEECRNIVEKIINKKELDNVVVAESLNDIDFEAFNQCEIIMSEVFEHNTLKEDTKILTKFMKSNCSKIIITTPNKSFNKYYSLSNDQLRHNDHKFEMTKEECHEYFDDLCKKFQNYSYIMTDIGDKVDGISTTLLIVIQKD